MAEDVVEDRIKCPVDSVSWNDAKEYINKLRRKHYGKKEKAPRPGPLTSHFGIILNEIFANKVAIKNHLA